MSSLLVFQRVKYKDQEWHKFLLAMSIGEKPYSNCMERGETP